MEERHIEDFLAGKFKDFEAEPLPGSFNAVMEKVSAAKEKKRRAAFLYTLSGIAALVVLYLALPLSDPYTKSSSSNISLKKTVDTEIKKAQKTNHHLSGKSSARTERTPAKSADLATSFKPTANTSTPENVSLLNNGYEPALASTEKEETLPGASETPFGQLLSDSKSETASKSKTQPGITEEFKTIASSEQTMTEVNAGVLKSLGLGMQFGKVENLATSRFDPKAEKDLLRLQALKFKARFFIGLSCQALLVEQTYALNSSNNTDPIKFSEDFKSAYVDQRRKESSRSIAAVPGLLFGVSLQHFEVRATLGAYQMKYYETIRYPEDSITGFSNTITPLGNPGSQLTRTVSPNTQFTQGEAHQNVYNFVFGSIGVNAILRFYNFQLKPGMAIAYNRPLKSTYTFVDSGGFQGYKEATTHLNKDVYTVSLRCGVAKRLSRMLELQVSPVYLMSMSSIFDERYFVSQRFNGFGIEGALIYKFPARLGK